MLLSSPEKRNGCQPAPGPGPDAADEPQGNYSGHE
ncbi:zinc finger protein 454, isoform CRA_b [Mus musculus]|nr:zinc finger protein 454, isoform CRA_b [Mus musculus]